MNVSEKTRAFLFWTVDLLKGSPVRKNLNEIIESIQNPNPEQIGSKRMELLSHAVETCPFYQSLAKDLELGKFPVVNKSIIRNSLNNFISSKYTQQKLIPVLTSGSTGTPFKTFQDKEKKLRNYADTLYFAGLAGYEIGHRLMYLKIWVEEKMKSKQAYWLQNMCPVDVVHLDDRTIDHMISQMEKDRSTFGILGYVSALETICQHLDRQNHPGVRANVRSIITMSEALNDYTKTSMEKYFGAPVVSRYSNLENGIIAQQEIKGKPGFLINTASYFVEILKMNSDEAAAEGETGRIVVTDLYNYAMPMIRYDTGDVGAMVSDPENPEKKYFSKIEGRKLDLLYDTKGHIVSSYMAYKNMWQYTDIKQYQLIQEGKKNYTFKINADPAFNREKQLIKEFRSFLGDDADFKIQYVDEIPLLSSGKRKKVVNLCYTND